LKSQSGKKNLEVEFQNKIGKSKFHFGKTISDEKEIPENKIQ